MSQQCYNVPKFEAFDLTLFPPVKSDYVATAYEGSDCKLVKKDPGSRTGITLHEGDAPLKCGGKGSKKEFRSFKLSIAFGV